MSLENNINRIANALELIAKSLAASSEFTPPTHEQKIANLADPKSKAAAPVVGTPPVPASTPAPATPATVTTPAEVPSAPAANVPPPPPSLEVKSPEECNALLVAEYNRLGGGAAMQRIIGIMENNFKVRSVTDLSKEQYGPLILAVRELK
jgi:hypothetical protein